MGEAARFPPFFCAFLQETLIASACLASKISTQVAFPFALRSVSQGETARGSAGFSPPTGRFIMLHVWLV
jgi:hypothetical protein